MQTLRQSADFERVRRDGRSWAHPSMILAAHPNQLPFNRYGLVVSRRVGSAVVRNRIRRLLRESLRGLHPKLATGRDIIIIARPAIAGQPFATVQATLEHLLRRARLVTPPEALS